MLITDARKKICPLMHGQTAIEDNFVECRCLIEDCMAWQFTDHFAGEEINDSNKRTDTGYCTLMISKFK